MVDHTGHLNMAIGYSAGYGVAVGYHPLRANTIGTASLPLGLNWYGEINYEISEWVGSVRKEIEDWLT